VTGYSALNMLNKLLSKRGVGATRDGPEMTRELMLAAFIMGVGLCLSGMMTHLYQALARQPAMLRFDGRTFVTALGNLAVSFVCGPYIMLQVGWRHEEGGAISMTSVLFSALVAFGWAFITGLLFMSAYVAIRY